ncbi:MAG: hypothetical protein US60_C0017G0015 [Microgenomates group bacterium GW2011_GWC1_37_8]|uniref:Uncharacterized protein n=1 Tax=Candidatus Woesebacteria bacterium GW2011_GWB1_38_8 TaxID=1618570 RepID=A0A0G0PA69_9BACT|nr:MAG: hypothetical protein US60_C0017G0015 [Microgenomates group bacterium GW2011_GWC1_37_8]KKQ86191.1 MAG: hypothetical protein UT08_C0001G0057 [Candidatus Woesebacteria bacterium GW2011_GWB1_38_8]
MREEAVLNLEERTQTLQLEKKRIVEWSRLARSHGYNHCSEGWRGFGDKSCLGYHGYFALLDALDLVSSPRAHEEFYLKGLGYATAEREGNDRPSVLIAGLATPALAEIASRGVEKGTNIDIIDICETPLLVTQEAIPILKSEHDLRIKKLDVLNPEGLLELANNRRLYSGIVTDAFLTRFKNEEKDQVLENFSRILRAGFGCLITTWRIKDERTDERGYGTDRDRTFFLENALSAAEMLQIPLSVDEISAAYEYASTMQSHGGQTLKEIKTIVGRHFKDVRVESTWPYPVYDVVPRFYAKIQASV